MYNGEPTSFFFYNEFCGGNKNDVIAGLDFEDVSFKKVFTENEYLRFISNTNDDIAYVQATYDDYDDEEEEEDDDDWWKYPPKD